MPFQNEKNKRFSSIDTYVRELRDTLLLDRTTGRNIIWATTTYQKQGLYYEPASEIYPLLMTGDSSQLVQPRVLRERNDQTQRTREKAEVFTPSWVCNTQNNLVDDAWFGKEGVFNSIDPEDPQKWITNKEVISFPKKGLKRWEKYVDAPRLEIACGEAPYLVSRYDMVSGEEILIEDRIGILDRKLRVVGENVVSDEEWIKWALRALQSSYGYEFQGDNLLLARQNIFTTFLEYYQYKFGQLPEIKVAHEAATIISWNLWQMDGMKYVVPLSCGAEMVEQISFLDENNEEIKTCPGCKHKDPMRHTGIYCKIMDWRKRRSIRFVDLLFADNENN